VPKKSERSIIVKTFFGGIFIEKEKLLDSGIHYPIKLEYYKTISTKDKKNKEMYGIHIVKTEYKENIKIEEKKIEYITDNENKVNEILKLFKENEVTPISAEYIIEDMIK
jgi:hypothetical protein